MEKNKRIIGLAIGIILILNGLIYGKYENLGIGGILTFLFGIGFLFIGFSKARHTIIKILKNLFLLGVTFIFALSIFIQIYGRYDTVNYNEDIVIVLGCGLNWDKPSKSLEGRLNTALLYYEKNPKVLIVVSGGKGGNEAVSEGYAMEEYLLNRGIPKESIIREERATSTYENLIYSNKILEEKFKAGYNIGIITTDYHIYRAYKTAYNIGLKNITHSHSKSLWYEIIPTSLRECVVVLRLWVLGR